MTSDTINASCPTPKPATNTSAVHHQEHSVIAIGLIKLYA
jgi:hypothetical protein